MEKINELVFVGNNQFSELQEINSLTLKGILSVRKSKGRIQTIYTWSNVNTTYAWYLLDDYWFYIFSPYIENVVKFEWIIGG